MVCERSMNFMFKSLIIVVVVLGGDSTPLGLALVAALEKSGFIVIASVATPEAVELLESRSHGYVRALVLDPSEVSQ